MIKVSPHSELMFCVFLIRVFGLDRVGLNTIIVCHTLKFSDSPLVLYTATLQLIYERCLIDQILSIEKEVVWVDFKN